MTGKRVFRMAPLQHHFELAGWAETTIVVRFWIIAGICVALGLGIFYVGLDPNHPSRPLCHPSPKHRCPWSKNCGISPYRVPPRCDKGAVITAPMSHCVGWLRVTLAPRAAAAPAGP
jgi:hypothetical protein